jgi:flagella basal body P-ring formation protein FlgA
MRFVLFVCGVMLPVAAQASSLRTITTLHGPNVTLSDLFDDSGRNAGRVLGSGPAPGGRIVIEAPQLDAIARQYDVGWRSISSGDRAVLEWPGRPLPKDAVVEAVRTAITAAGDIDDFDVDLPDFVPPTIPAEAAPVSAVSDVDLDKLTGRFSAMLTVTAGGMNPAHMKLAGRIELMTEAPVAVARMLVDTVVRVEDVRMARIRKPPSPIAGTIEQVAGMQLRRPVAAGLPLRLEDVFRPALVQRGSVVIMELTSPGLTVTGPAVVVDSGVKGEVVRVQPKNSSSLVFAEIVGPGQVKVVLDGPRGVALPASRLQRAP